MANPPSNQPIPNTHDKGVPLSENVKLVWDHHEKKYMVVRSNSDWRYLDNWETSLFVAGYSQGCDHGNKDGYKDGYDDGYDAGCDDTRCKLM